MSEPTEHLSELDRIERDELHGAFRYALRTQGGQRLIYWMLEQCAIYRDAYTGDAASTNYTLGQQASGRRLISKLDEIDPQFYPQLLLHIAEIRSCDRAAADAMTNPEDDDEYAP